MFSFLAFFILYRTNLIKNLKENEKFTQVVNVFFESMKFDTGLVDITLDIIEKNYNLLDSFRGESIKQQENRQ